VNKTPSQGYKTLTAH